MVSSCFRSWTTPLAILTDDAEARLPALVDRFADRVVRESPTPAEASLLLSCGFILMGLRYDKAVAQTLFHGVQKMRESSTYQAILEEGFEKGREEGLASGLVLGRQDDVLALLQERFGALHITAPAELPL